MIECCRNGDRITSEYAAEVEDVVKRSISGHASKKMGDHYSTVNAGEQLASIAKVIDLFGAGRATSSSSETIGGTSGGTQHPGGGTQNEKTG